MTDNVFYDDATLSLRLHLYDSAMFVLSLIDDRCGGRYLRGAQRSFPMVERVTVGQSYQGL